MQKLNIFWNRSDTRLNDNPALYYAVDDSLKNNVELLTLFILDPHFVMKPIYSRRLRYMSTILESFQDVIDQNVVKGELYDVFRGIADNYDINVYYNADFEPYGRSRDLALIERFRGTNVVFISLEDKISINLSAKTGTGNLYSVFTPFKKNVMEGFLNTKVLPKVELTKVKQISLFPKFNFIEFRDELPPLSIEIEGEVIDLSNLDKDLDYDWYSSEDEVLKSLDGYIKNGYFSYNEDRNDLTIRNSMLSVALKWGMISPRYIKQEVVKIDPSPQDSTYISELIWREFYKYLLYHYPKLYDQEFQSKYRDNPKMWVDKRTQLSRFKKWINSETGYIIVDASMRQIVEEGYMHNRSRMIVGSILTKNLGVDWRYGQEYFRAMLLDLDEASNNGGWQWSASVGADPKPIRIFNPYTQDEKFDIKGGYKKKYLPIGYGPTLIIEHTKAREEVLERYRFEK